MTASGWDDARNVLCIRLDGMGDLLMTTPAIRALKAGRPNRRITLLTSPAGANVAPYLPEVDSCLVYEAPWMKATPNRLSARPDMAMIQSIRAQQFDAAVIFTVYSQNPLPAAMLAYLADIPLRLAHCRENPYQLLTDHVPEPEPGQRIRHEVQRQLDLVAAVDCHADDTRLSFAVPPAARRRAEQALDSAGLDRSRPWAVIHPGATATSRRYAARSFGSAAASLVREHGLQIAITGERADVPTALELMDAAAAVPLTNLVGRLDIAGLAATLSMASVVVTNNTGPAHLAAAVGTPVVDLYALTNPQHTPWGVPNRVLFHDVPCKFCYRSTCPEGHHACLALVPPEAVVTAALELISDQSDQQRPARAGLGVPV